MQPYESDLRPKPAHHHSRHVMRRAPAPHVAERVSASETVIVERKSFQISLRENSRGKFLCISEERLPNPLDPRDYEPRRNRIIIPIGGISDFTLAIQKVLST